MKDKIILHNMMFYGFHGTYEHERELGQRFYVDAELVTDSSMAGKTDDLRHTVDYTAVYAKIKEIVENRRFQLLEALAGNIAESVLAWDKIDEVTVRVRKPAVPIPGQLDYVQFEMTRSRMR